MRLIDADALISKMQTVMDMQGLYLPIHFKEWLIDDAPTIKELEIISELFGSPCDYSPTDEFMQDKSEEWCEKNCGKVSDEQCWERYIKLKLKEMNNQN